MRAALGRSAPASDRGPRTIAIPIDALGLDHITVTEAPPAVVSKVNASHVGMTGDGLVRVLREMRAHRRFRDAVIARGKYRAAPPDAVLAYLREVPEAARDETDDEDSDLDEGLLRAAGFAPPAATSTRSKGGGR